MPASLEKVVKLVENWRPRNCKTEKDFERSLFKHLEKNLEKSEVIKQYAVGRIRGDIVVDKQILIEIKKDLNSTSAYQRLLGQIEDYGREWDGYVILALCGDIQRDLTNRVKKKAKDYICYSKGWVPLPGPKIYIREK